MGFDKDSLDQKQEPTSTEVDVALFEKSPALQRILDDIKVESDVYDRYDRTHNRHNR